MKKQEKKEVKLLIREELREPIKEISEMFYQANLIRATAQVTSQAMASGKTPDEAVAMYAQTYESMQDWFSGKPIKDQMKTMLESMMPDSYY